MSRTRPARWAGPRDGVRPRPRDEFPVPVVKVTPHRWRVPTTLLLRLLGLEPDPAGPTAKADRSPAPRPRAAPVTRFGSEVVAVTDHEDDPRDETRLYHTTDSADRILAEGFRDVFGPFHFGNRPPMYGVLVAACPTFVDESPEERRVLELTLPAGVVDLDAYAVKERSRPVTEWCVPAELLNRRARVRLLDPAELETLPGAFIMSAGWMSER